MMPKTKLGQWSVGLIVIMAALFGIGTGFVNYYQGSGITSGNSIVADLAARPGIAIPMLLAFASGISAFVIGFQAIYRHHDRGALVYISTVIGGLLTIFLLLELIFPH